MDLVIPPVAVGLNPQGGGDAQALQPGQVVEALVARVIDPAHVQLALGAMLIDVQTEVPLVAGSRVRLAVKATPDGMRLVLGQSTPAGEATVPSAAPASSRMPALTTAIDGQGPVSRDAPAVPAATSTAPAAVLAAAVRSAAATQSGLAPLLADAAAAASFGGLPEPVRQAVLKLLAFQLPSDMAVEADQLRRAFARSGLFLEANLDAAARSSPSAAAPALTDDIKAALVALRAALTQTSGSARLPPAAGQGAVSTADAALSGALAPTLGAAAGRVAITDAQTLYRALLQAVAETGAMPPSRAIASAAAVATGKPDAGQAPPFADNPPPPPYRGALPVAQPPARPSIEATQPPDKIMQVLLAETDGALARQTLLQAASLPDQGSAAAGTHRPEASVQRWAFEIPFATPQGPTIAQFEIARDAQGRGQDRIAPIWRARFAVDIEPLGAIHAQVAVMGERTAVTLWAERAESAALMRNSVQSLTDDLRAADLEPLEVVVRAGSPPRPRATLTASAGRFLDCAS